MNQTIVLIETENQSVPWTIGGWKQKKINWIIIVITELSEQRRNDSIISLI